MKYSEYEKLIEKLADLCHEQWIGWMKYLFSKCEEEKSPDDIGASCIVMRRTGKLIIPEEFVNRWKKQMNTNYKDLSEKEKESDRVEAKKFIKLLEKEGSYDQFIFHTFYTEEE